MEDSVTGDSISAGCSLMGVKGDLRAMGEVRRKPPVLLVAAPTAKNVGRAGCATALDILQSKPGSFSEGFLTLRSMGTSSSGNGVSLMFARQATLETLRSMPDS